MAKKVRVTKPIVVKRISFYLSMKVQSLQVIKTASSFFTTVILIV